MARNFSTTQSFSSRSIEHVEYSSFPPAFTKFFATSKISPCFFAQFEISSELSLYRASGLRLKTPVFEHGASTKTPSNEVGRFRSDSFFCKSSFKMSHSKTSAFMKPTFCMFSTSGAVRSGTSTLTSEHFFTSAEFAKHMSAIARDFPRERRRGRGSRRLSGRTATAQKTSMGPAHKSTEFRADALRRAVPAFQLEEIFVFRFSKIFERNERGVRFRVGRLSEKNVRRPLVGFQNAKRCVAPEFAEPFFNKPFRVAVFYRKMLRAVAARFESCDVCFELSQNGVDERAFVF